MNLVRFHWGVALLAWLGLGCQFSFTRDDISDLARQTGARSVVLDPEMTLWSPFDTAPTQLLVVHMREALAAIETLIEVDVGPMLTVVFIEVDLSDEKSDNPQEANSHVEQSKSSAKHRLRGYSSVDKDVPLIGLYIPTNAEFLRTDSIGRREHIDDAIYEVMRHEIAHACVNAAGLAGPTWFSEGVAEEIEAREFNGVGELVQMRLPSGLQIARDYHHLFTIDDLLDWKETIILGQEDSFKPFKMGRPLSLALIRFLLQRDVSMTYRQGLERILAMTDDELRALNTEWKRWLEALPG